MKTQQDFQHPKQYYQWADSINIHYFSQPNDLIKKIKIAETYLQEGFGYFFLESIAKNSTNCPICQELLKKHKLYAPPPSSFQKLWHHFRKGNLQYIGIRIWQKIKHFVAYYAHIFHLKQWALLFVFIFLKVLAITLFRKAKYYLSFFLVIWLLLLNIYFFYPLEKQKIIITSKDNFNLSMQNDFKIGQIIFIPKNETDVVILQGRNVHQAYQDLLKNHQVILATSLAFSDFEGNPDGLSIQQGKVLNPTLLSHYGAVLNNANQQLSVIKKENYKTIEQYMQFVNQSRRQHNNVLQTNLLAYENQLVLTENPKAFLRERRLIAFVKNEKTQQEYYVVFNITHTVTIFDISVAILNFLENQNLHIQALINVDTGANNILEYFDSKHQKSREIKGFFPVKYAENLVVFFHQ